MKSKENILWLVVGIIVLAALCSYFLVDDFKAANGQFYRDATHTYSDRICRGDKHSRVCTNYFFTEEQYNLNKIIDKVYLVLFALVLVIAYLQKTIYPPKEDKLKERARMDPINTAQTAWEGLMKENEKQKKDPNLGWTTSGKKTFLYLTLLVIGFTVLGVYFENSSWLREILRMS